MVKNSYLIIILFVLSHCSIDTKTGLWEKKNKIQKEKKITEVLFDKDQNFAEFKQNVIFYSKNSKFPNIMDD